MARELRVMSTQEVADFFGVHRVTVSKWTARGQLPAPDAQLAIGPVWRTTTVERWGWRTGRIRACPNCGRRVACSHGADMRNPSYETQEATIYYCGCKRL